MSGRLTQLEWWALCAAAAEREESLNEREHQGERLGQDRAMAKVRAQLGPTGRWDTTRR